ncbi:MAG: hypothetical protein WC713_00880 [Candidatus Methylomirabilota bacterium]|jgi:hypothetical protein
MPEYIPRAQLPTQLAALVAQLAAQQNDPIARAIQSVGQSFGGAMSDIGERKRQEQLLAAQQAQRTKEQEAARIGGKEQSWDNALLDAATGGAQFVNMQPGQETPVGGIDLTQLRSQIGLPAGNFAGQYLVPAPKKTDNLIDITPKLIAELKKEGITGLVPGSRLSPESLLRTITQKEISGEKVAAAEKKEEKKLSKEQSEREAAFRLYETARDGLLSGLEKSATGPIVGRLPAVTAKQQTAEGAVSAMAPVLKQLFRVSGEGVFTDRDQELLINMVPKRSDKPAARVDKTRNIDNIVRAKLKMAPNPETNSPTSTNFVRMEIGGKSWDVPADKVADAEKRGAKRL